MPHNNSEFLSTQEEELRIVIVGRRGTGKSSSGNTILGKEWFYRTMFRLSLLHCSKDSAVVDGQHISVIDTPYTFMRCPYGRLMDQCVGLSAPGPHVFLVVTRLDRFTEEEKQMMQDMKEMFSPDVDRYCMVLFTGGDQLEDTMEEFLDRSPDRRDLVARCNGRYHVFDNTLKGKDQSQVTELLHKAKNIVQENGGGYYTIEMFKEVMRKIEEQLQRKMEEEEQRRQAEEEEEKQLRQTKKEKERGGQRAECSCNII